MLRKKLKMHVVLERTHTVDKRVKVKTGSLTLATTSKEEAIKRALEYAADPQVRIFGDTGMCDGKYTVRVLTIDGEPV
jgi:hypothetical protein